MENKLLIGVSIIVGLCSIGLIGSAAYIIGIFISRIDVHPKYISYNDLKSFIKLIDRR